MKFYETHFDDYLYSSEKINIHPELVSTIRNFPRNIVNLKNTIFYGPPGVGKYTQVLKILKKYSPTELKYEKKMKLTTEKQDYLYKISDIHYEIDMSLLGCNSKIIWHEVFLQIVDIISVKQDKIGIILCKNFQNTHNELLDNFYSYMQHFSYSESNIKIKFFILCEHVSFIPEQIINCSQIVNIKRPDKKFYNDLILLSSVRTEEKEKLSETFLEKILYHKTAPIDHDKYEQTKQILDFVNTEGVVNAKEIRSFCLIKQAKDLPKDIFNIVCDKLIENIAEKDTLSFTNFRDNLYDILTYNIDISECLYYILSYFIKTGELKSEDTHDILLKTHPFLKYYNNNYRPIYHLESIMFYIINKIQNYK